MTPEATPKNRSHETITIFSATNFTLTRHIQLYFGMNFLFCPFFAYIYFRLISLQHFASHSPHDWTRLFLDLLFLLTCFYLYGVFYTKTALCIMRKEPLIISRIIPSVASFLQTSLLYIAFYIIVIFCILCCFSIIGILFILPFLSVLTEGFLKAAFILDSKGSFFQAQNIIEHIYLSEKESINIFQFSLWVAIILSFGVLYGSLMMTANPLFYGIGQPFLPILTWGIFLLCLHFIILALCSLYHDLLHKGEEYLQKMEKLKAEKEQERENRIGEKAWSETRNMMNDVVRTREKRKNNNYKS